MKYHYLYKVTCVVTGEYYIGIHSTNDLNDGYTGSGKFLQESYDKYGYSSHEFEAFEFVENREDLLRREGEVVNAKVVRDPLCLNIRLGGAGWFDPIVKNYISRILSIIAREKLKEPGYKEEITARLIRPNWSGRTHTQETKIKIGKKNKLLTGSRNSQYGTYWITNGVLDKKWKDKRGDIPADFYRGRSNPVGKN